MRPWTEKVYGIPPEQVIGSSGKTKFELRDGKPVLLKLPEIEFIDDKEGKPVGINRFIGRRPILAFGNSDGDQQMLEYTAGSPNSLMLIVHHDDADREYAMIVSLISERLTKRGMKRFKENGRCEYEK